LKFRNRQDLKPLKENQCSKQHNSVPDRSIIPYFVHIGIFGGILLRKVPVSPKFM